MPVNRNALIRYKTIDKCLQNRFRKWTLEDLIESCSDALYEYEGNKNGISKRTIQLDIQTMRSDKLGYNAPIIVVNKKHYTYEDASYSITKIPLTDGDLFLLKDVVSTLEQFSSFSHFSEFGGIIRKLEDQLNVKSNKENPLIDFDKNENLKGLEYLDICYQAVSEKKVLSITYKSFKAKSESNFHIHPQFLKEFNNRWFMIGVKEKNDPILTLALDRIISVEILEKRYVDLNLVPNEYYKDVIGVTVSVRTRTQNIVFHVERNNAPYVLTKPLHRSQIVLQEDKNGTIFQISVQPNFELERLLLGFGAGITVIKPKRLKNKIIRTMQKALENYGKD